MWPNVLKVLDENLNESGNSRIETRISTCIAALEMSIQLSEEEKPSVISGSQQKLSLLSTKVILLFHGCPH